MNTVKTLAASALMILGFSGLSGASFASEQESEIVSIVKKLESGRTVTFNIEGTPIKNDAGEVVKAKVSYDLETAQVCADPAGALAPAVEEHKDWEKDGAYMLMVVMDHGDSLKREVNKDNPNCHDLSELHFSMGGPWTFSFNFEKQDAKGEFENVKFDVSAFKP